MNATDSLGVSVPNASAGFDGLGILHGLLGIAVLLAIAYAFSSNKKAIPWKAILGGFSLQLILGFFIIQGDNLRNVFAPLGWVKDAFSIVGKFFVLILNFTSEGAKFVFGPLGTGSVENIGFVFAFQVLPTVIFFAAFMALLYYLGIMQRIVQVMAILMTKVMRTSGAESLCASANIFVGHTEAPLMIKPYLEKLTRSELLAVMLSGMATIAGGVMAVYVQVLGTAYAKATGMGLEQAQVIFATHLLAGSVMAAPTALVITKILIPETGTPETLGKVKVQKEKEQGSFIEALASGTSDGLKMSLNIAAMLIAFIAFIAFVNYILESFGWWTGLNYYLRDTYGVLLNFQFVVGYPLQLIAYVIGVPSADAIHFGSLLGTKTILNEFVAYTEMAGLIESGKLSNMKSILMLTYTLCGFASIASIGIQIGGIGALVPERKSEIAKLGALALLGGTITTLITAAVAGIFYSFS